MSIFGGTQGFDDTDVVIEGENLIVQNLVLSELQESMTTDEFNTFLESEECEILTEKGILSKKTIVRLDKVDDLERRTSLAAMGIEKQAKSSDWKEYRKAMEKAMKLKAKIIKKNKSKASRIAKKAQKEYLKVPKLRMTQKQFKKA